MAALLAFAESGRSTRDREVVEHGERFLRFHEAPWDTARTEEIPLGGAFVVRRLLLDAARAGLDVDLERYAAVMATAEERLAHVASLPWPAGSVPLHYWETWGEAGDPSHQSADGDIGTSPAATAYWLARGADGPAAASARAYLQRAARATGAGVPGVVPTVHPLERTEQAFVLYALVLIADRVGADVIAAATPHLADLEATYKSRGGISHTDGFETDADDTAVAACVLTAAGRPVDPATILASFRGEHFATFAFERTPSVSTNAHCLHALALLGEPCAPALRFLLSQRSDDGLWRRDRWHTSWCYVTAHAIAALCALGEHHELQRTTDALCAVQHADGGFGASRVDTAQVAIALGAIERSAGQLPGLRAARQAVARRLAHGDGAAPAPALWTGKEPYSPRRLDRGWELAALAG